MGNNADRVVRRWGRYVLVAAGLVVLAANAYATYATWRDCDGRLVRGMFWWECVSGD